MPPNFTGATVGLAAGAQTNDSSIDYAQEATYGVSPTDAYQALRFTGETLKGSTTRNRPDEINAIREAAQGVTTQISASGTISGALSSGTYDDLLAGVMGNDWTNGALTNGNMDKSYTFRKKLLGGFVHYRGTIINQVQIQMQQGSFATISVDLISAEELRSQTDIAKSVNPAPTGRVFNTVNNFLKLMVNGKVPGGCATSVSLTFARDGSGADYGNGSAAACGMRLGSYTATGSLELYFRSFDEWDAAKAELQGEIIIQTADNAGNGYEFKFLNALLTDPAININQKNATVKATFSIEGNPLETGGTTVTITKLPVAGGGSGASGTTGG
ncbi:MULTISPECIES: phage tail tube protein [Acetobacter]|uniref:phage tail tube protein n=1 Tax=Acetobacter TaxID=434 RepID=UPI0039E8CC59